MESDQNGRQVMQIIAIRTLTVEVLSARVHSTLSSSKKKRTKVSCQELRTTKMATEVERKRSEDGREGESSSRRGV